MAEVFITVLVLLAARLARPDGRRARIEAIGLESFMTGFCLAIFVFSLLIGGWSVSTAGLAGLVGAGLSGAAVGGLLGADARRYCGAGLRN